jgi:hypothetical protein
MKHELIIKLKPKPGEGTEGIISAVEALGFEIVDTFEITSMFGDPPRGADVMPGIRRWSRVRCIFCGKNQHEVKKMAAGPAIYICDGCADASAEITRDHD